MSPPPVQPAEDKVTEAYESDEYDEEDNNSGAEDGDDYQEEDGVDDAEDDDEEGPQKGKSLTEHLLLDNNNVDDLNDDEDDEDDGAFVPGGGVDPADEEVDGDKRVSAIGLKRKTSGDEDDAEDDASEETDAKRVKADE